MIPLRRLTVTNAWAEANLMQTLRKWRTEAEKRGFTRIAELSDYLQADERTHVKLGTDWIRELTERVARTAKNSPPGAARSSPEWKPSGPTAQAQKADRPDDVAVHLPARAANARPQGQPGDHRGVGRFRFWNRVTHCRSGPVCPPGLPVQRVSSIADASRPTDERRGRFTGRSTQVSPLQTDDTETPHNQ